MKNLKLFSLTGPPLLEESEALRKRFGRCKRLLALIAGPFADLKIAKTGPQTSSEQQKKCKPYSGKTLA
jgi:hypothetical protein